MNRTLALGFFSFFIADIAGDGESLAGVDFAGIFDLVAIGLIKERPKEGVTIYIRSFGDSPQQLPFADGVAQAQFDTPFPRQRCGLRFCRGDNGTGCGWQGRL